MTQLALGVVAVFALGARATFQEILGGFAIVEKYAYTREAMELEVALRGEQARKEYEGYVFAFLVPLDPIVQ